MKKGWFGERYKHSLAAKGIKTKQFYLKSKVVRDWEREEEIVSFKFNELTQGASDEEKAKLFEKNNPGLGKNKTVSEKAELFDEFSQSDLDTNDKIESMYDVLKGMRK